MDQQRKGEIALALLKHKLGNEGLKLNSSFRKNLAHAAKATGIPLPELTEFALKIIEDLAREHVSLKIEK